MSMTKPLTDGPGRCTRRMPTYSPAQKERERRTSLLWIAFTS